MSSDVADSQLPVPIAYIARDIERAMGLPPTTESYAIITNDSPIARERALAYPHMLRIQNDTPLDTHQLLLHPGTKPFLDATFPTETMHRCLVFKPTLQIERAAEQEGFLLLNPPAALAQRIEDKISQVHWLRETGLDRYLPYHELCLLKEVSYTGDPLIVQMNHAHTGKGTVLLDSPEVLADLVQRFPEREVRISEYIEGPVCTLNSVVAKDGVLCGNISYQITGTAPFTNQQFATVGNDWGLAGAMLDPQQAAEIRHMATAIGEQLRHGGWRGLFGIDVSIDEHTGQAYLLEINARQPASTTFESQLITIYGDGITVFEAHLRALLDEPLTHLRIGTITNGAQVILRTQGTISTERMDEAKTQLEARGLAVLAYNPQKEGDDMLRIQTAEHFYTAPHVQTPLLKDVVKILTTTLAL